MNMPAAHTADLKELLDDPATVGTIATLDESGAPHAVPSPFLRLDAAGRLVHLELLETSHTHRNLLRSVWFDRPVSIVLSGTEGRVLVLKGRVHKAHVSGPLFSDYYREVREQLGDADLAGVWLIEIQEVINETYALRKAREEELHPFFLHLDRLAVQQP
jgi:predicted pyridoxine 5'-phosphate oxidase superfamily flavin-nucleotide-binding protein